MSTIVFFAWAATFIMATILLVAYFKVTRWCKSLESERDEAKEELEYAERRAEHRAERNVNNMVDEKIKLLKEQFDKINVDIVSQALLKPTMRDLYMKVHSMAKVRAERNMQEFFGHLIDDVEGLSRNLKEELNDKIWDAFQGYKTTHKDLFYVFPDNVKVAYTKGKRTVFVIEQKPQTRTVSFTPKLVKHQNVADQAREQISGAYRYTLSFPYIFFVCVFDNELLAVMEIYFRNKPLTSAREYIYLAPLPNIFQRDGDQVPMICMGEDFSERLHAETTMARQCDFAISEFWQRSFNGDLGTGNHKNLDPRIANYAVWQQNTEENPLFILEVTWPKGKTVKGVVDSHLDLRGRSHELDPLEIEIRDQLDAGTEAVRAKIEEIIQETIKKRYKFSPEENEAKILLQDLLRKHAAEVFSKVTIIKE